MLRAVITGIERRALHTPFRIARGSRTQIELAMVTIRQGDAVGRGEGSVTGRYGESVESVTAQLRAVEGALADGVSRDALRALMPAGSARNAVDCALWDLEAKITGKTVAERILGQAAKPLVTAYTISLADPETMAAKTAENAGRPLLKIKTGTADDEARLRAVRAAAPEARIIIDANEGWNDYNIEYYLRLAAELKISLIEQPLPAGKDDILARIDHPVLICADESVHSTKDLAGLRDRYDAINIKLDKTGGLTEALVMKAEAERLGFTIMVGCMLGTSLGMAPAVLAAQGAAFADLDGPLLLAQDREPGLVYEGSLVYPARPELWG